MSVTKEEQPDNKPTFSIGQKRTIAFIVLVVFALWGLNWWLLVNKGETDRGTFGDMFGAVNSLFSGLAFAGIIYTILLQRNELELQREELRSTRAEFEQQNETFRLQRFENTFFSMLDLQNDIIAGLRMGPVQYRSEGREVIGHAKSALENVLQSYHYSGVKHDVPIDASTARLVISQIYFGYYKNYEIHLNHYFRNLYHIFKFIYFSPLPPDRKKFYSSVVRAQLSQNELYILAFNLMIDRYGYPNFTFLAKELDILQNFGWDDVQPGIYQQMILEVINSVSNPFLDYNQ
jgi:hypothetical protein